MSNMVQTISPNEPLTHKHIHDKAIEKHLERIGQEFKRGFEFLQKYPKSVSMFGSSMISAETEYYKHAYELAKRVSGDLGYTIINGGGPGIMEATARGAQDADGRAVGLRIHLVHEKQNDFTMDGIDFNYFFARKTMLAFAAEAYIFFPGGYGTFDELFGILTLIQTSKIPRVPVVLFESSFWNPLKEFIDKQMLGNVLLIEPADANIFEITDSHERVLDVIKRAPVSGWWRNIN